MTITIHLPADLDEAAFRQAESDAREAIAIRLYREGKLSHGRLAAYLGLDRAQVEHVLAKHGVVDEFSIEEIIEQAGHLRLLRQGGSKP
jgi:predicted HTH domain antitoxin